VQRPLRAAFAGALLLISGNALRAQRAPTLAITLPPPEQVARTGPLIVATNMLSSPRARDPLAAGFPARFHFLVTLWSEGNRFGNAIERRAEYDVIVSYSAMEKKYRVVQIVNDRALELGKFEHVEDAERAIARPTRAPITAPSSNKHFYYRATLDVTILNSSDLDEVNRWLKGELEPAIHGEHNPGTALTRSLRYLASRVLGGDSREFDAETPPFRVP
jgi:hypothetical protein